MDFLSSIVPADILIVLFRESRFSVSFYRIFRANGVDFGFGVMEFICREGALMRVLGVGCGEKPPGVVGGSGEM